MDSLSEREPALKSGRIWPTWRNRRTDLQSQAAIPLPARPGFERNVRPGPSRPESSLAADHPERL